MYMSIGASWYNRLVERVFSTLYLFRLLESYYPASISKLMFYITYGTKAN